MKYVIGCAEDYFNYCRDLKVNPHANKEVVHLNSPQKICGRRFTEDDEFILGRLTEDYNQLIAEVKARGGLEWL